LIPVNLALVAAPWPGCERMPQIRAELRIGGICRPRFTAPKVLRSMVRIPCNGWNAPT
jgi:hypothetical protein